MNSCMKQALLILFVSFVLQQDVASDSSANNTSPTTLSTTPQAPTTANTTTGNSTIRDEKENTTPSQKGDGLHRGDTNGMLQRSLYVAVAVSALVAIYFIVRWIKTRGRRKAKKYGVIHGTGELELQPLEKHTDEDEEDMTLFDVKDSKRPK